MIFLTVEDASDTDYTVLRQEADDAGVVFEDTEDIIEQISEVLDYGPKQGANVTAKRAVDKDGNVYTDVKVHYTSVFTLNGERWVADGAIAINVDSAIREMRESMRRAFPEEAAAADAEATRVS